MLNAKVRVCSGGSAGTKAPPGWPLSTSGDVTLTPARTPETPYKGLLPLKGSIILKRAMLFRYV